MKVLLIPIILFILGLGCQSNSDSSKSIDVLIVDGFSNHDWKQTSHIVKTILEEVGLFEVSVSTSPSEPEDPEWKNWRPVFEDYDVIIQNTNNINNKKIKWPVEVEKSLENYIRSGGGLYVLHSANNAFPEWTESEIQLVEPNL